MNRLFKRFAAIAVIVLSVLLLVACDDSTNKDKVREARDNLKVEHILGENESKDKITKDLDLKSSDGDVTITWKSSNKDVIGNDGKVTRPENEDKNVTMTATFSFKDANDTKDFKLKVLKVEEEEKPIDHDEYPEVENRVTISDFVAEEEGFEATILGVITSLAPYNSFSMEDDTGAVAFRIGGKNTDSIDFEVGDLIVAKVKKNTFNGLIQAELVGDDYEIVKGDFPRLPVLDLNDIGVDKDTLSNYQSRIAKADGLVVEEVKVDQYGTIDINAKLGDQTIIVRWDNRIKAVNNAYLLTLEEGDEFNVDGITIGWHNNPQLTVGRTEDVTGEGYEEAILKGTFLQTVNSFKFESLDLSEDTKLDLVSKIDDVNVSWDVLEGADYINLETGDVTIPEEKTTLKLEATFTQGDFEEIREFEFVLSKGVVVTSMFYEDTSTTNMDLGNNAELVNLDPEIFNVLSTPRQIAPHNLHVGLNRAGNIRLYGSSTYDSKNTLAVLIKEGYTITKLEIDFGPGSNSPSKGLLMLGDEAIDLGADDFNDLKVYDELSIDGFSIRNNQEGGSNNSQIFINKITITYKEENADSKFTPVPQFELTFNTNGGEDINSYFFEEGDKIKLATPKKEGAIFLGWFKDEELTEEVDEDMLVTEDLTVFAKWQEKSDEELVAEAVNALNIDTSDVHEEKTLELPKTGINDTTIGWDVVEGEDIIDLETGLITLPNKSVTLVLEATITLNDATDTKRFEIEVIVVEEPDNLVEYHETFDTSTLGGQYNDVSFEGVNGIIWDVGHSRDEGEYEIDGKGIMFRRGSDSYLEATFPNGIFDFSFDIRKAFTGGTTRDVEVYLNGDLYATERFAEADRETDVYTFKYVLDIIEEVTIKLKPKVSGGHQMTVDNFIWREVESDDPVDPDPVEGGEATLEPKEVTGSALDAELVNAAALSLDPDIFTVDFKDNQNKSGLGMWSPIRMYGGTELKVSIKEGYKIIKIDVDSASSPNNAKVVIDGVETTLDTETVFELISVNSFELINIATGQFRFNNIKITYVVDENGDDPIEDDNKYETLDDMKVAFLTDLYEYANPSEDLETFMHGEGNDSGFNGTWIPLIQNNDVLYTINSKEEDASKPFFINQPEYNEKWLPLLDYIDEIETERVPDGPYFWASPYTGLRRINHYFLGTLYNAEQLANWPEVYQK